MGCKLLQEIEEDIEANLCHVSHGVLEGPHHGVHEDLELRGRNLKVCWKGRIRERKQYIIVLVLLYSFGKGLLPSGTSDKCIKENLHILYTNDISLVPYYRDTEDTIQGPPNHVSFSCVRNGSPGDYSLTKCDDSAKWGPRYHMFLLNNKPTPRPP